MTAATVRYVGMMKCKLAGQVQQLVDVQNADSAECYKAHCAEVYHHSTAHSCSIQASSPPKRLSSCRIADRGQSQNVLNRLDDHDLMFC